MTWPSALVVTAATILGVALGAAAGQLRWRARLRRVAAGAAELAGGNLAHRIIMPGDDEAARAADALNALADSIQGERETAAARDAAQRRLLANVSHDLRTPITSIAGYVDALRRGLGDEPERYLGVIAGKTDDLAQLTDDLFYAARLDAGDLDLRRQPLDLAEAVRRGVLGFAGQLAGIGCEVDVSVPEGPCLVAVDPSAVARILSNVIANSLRHAEGMTRFAVELVASPGAYTLRLTNDGPALPADTSAIFQRGVAAPGGGTGLGLAIAKELAERMGGAVSAENTADGLVTFTLIMPGTVEFSGS